MPHSQGQLLPRDLTRQYPRIVAGVLPAMTDTSHRRRRSAPGCLSLARVAGEGERHRYRHLLNGDLGAAK